MSDISDNGDSADSAESVDSANESDYSESDTETGESISSDNDEYFIRFDSATNYDHVDYVMIGANCYALTDDDDNDSINQDENQDEDTLEENVCLGCQHDVLVYFINGYIDQQMMAKSEINDICRLQGINLSSHDVFNHLLE
jgi:hypothetical protein